MIAPTGEVCNHYEYDAFGNFTVRNEQVENRFGYAGEQLDLATNLYYLRARFYSPVIARFIQEDSYLGDGLNLYAYVKNNPVMYVDPSGHYCEPKYETPQSGVGGEGTSSATKKQWSTPEIETLNISETGSNRIIVTEDVIKNAMKDAPLKTQQKAVSVPVIQEYVDRVLAGEINMPNIKVDSNIIVDGNHRYITSRITGIDIGIQPWSGGDINRVIEWDDVILDLFDWGNR